jgi:hypothetical protein
MIPIGDDCGILSAGGYADGDDETVRNFRFGELRSHR